MARHQVQHAAHHHGSSHVITWSLVVPIGALVPLFGALLGFLGFSLSLALVVPMALLCQKC